MNVTIASPVTRTAVAAGLGLVLSTLVGALATLGGDQDSLRFVVFTLTTAPVAIGAVLVLTGEEKPVEHQEDTVEHAWAERAGAGSFTDLLIALGLATAASAVLDVRELPLVFFLVLGMGGFAVRYAVQSRRG